MSRPVPTPRRRSCTPDYHPPSGEGGGEEKRENDDVEGGRGNSLKIGPREERETAVLRGDVLKLKYNHVIKILKRITSRAFLRETRAG